MVTDSKLLFDSGVAVTTSKQATNSVDLDSINKLGKGSPIFFNVKIMTAFACQAGEQLVVHLVSSSDATGLDQGDTTGVSLTFSHDEVETLGKTKRIAIPPSLDPGVYLSAFYYVETTALATGTLSCYLTIGDDSDV